MDIVGALIYKYPDKEFVITGTDYSGLDWLDSSDKPSLEELQEAYGEYISLGIDPYKQEDWEGLQSSLRGTHLFAKAIMTSNVNGFSLLLSTLTNTRNLQDLEFAFNLVRSGLAQDFTKGEIDQINGLLVKHGIKLELSV